MPIRRLSQSLVNKIAAGEVIERPASVVKELLENSLDAGASRIDVSVEQGGLELIRIADDGCGIPADELPLALASHATSKLSDVDDLFRIQTLGFRGEALASIAEISRLTLRSRTAASPAGAEITANGGQISEPAPCGCPTGTVIEVRNLFFNTPVRRKFLRSTQTEFGHIGEAFTRIALAAPHLHLTLRHNDRTVYELAPHDGLTARIGKFFGQEVAQALIPVESEADGVRLSGYVATPAQSRSHNRMQYLFLNGRFIRDRSLQHALGEAYRGLLMVGRYPIAFLTLTMPPELVDVNVHPTKLEVRFQDSGRLYSQLLSTLRLKFLATDLTARGQAPPQPGAAAAAAPGAPTAANPAPGEGEFRQRFVDWAKSQLGPAMPSPAIAAPPASLPPAGIPGEDDEPWSRDDRDQSAGVPAPLTLERLSRPWTTTATPLAHSSHAASECPAESAAEHDPASSPSPCACGLRGTSPTPHSAPPALQVHNRYLVAETDEGVTIIDQHALHERILYEQLRQRIEAGPIETQSLLVPEPVDLTPAEAAAALEHREVFAQLGIRLEPFGGGTVLVAGFPALLSNLRPADVLRGLLERLLGAGKEPDRRDLLDELLHTIACKAAIKAGDRLTPEEMSALLEQRHLVDDAHHCPHGRPTALVFTREQLDRQFRRI